MRAQVHRCGAGPDVWVAALFTREFPAEHLLHEAHQIAVVSRGAGEDEGLPRHGYSARFHSMVKLSPRIRIAWIRSPWGVPRNRRIPRSASSSARPESRASITAWRA